MVTILISMCGMTTKYQGGKATVTEVGAEFSNLVSIAGNRFAVIGADVKGEPGSIAVTNATP